ncbi:MAG: metallophosphoesterase family protein [Bacteroidota bacterium]
MTKIGLISDTHGWLDPGCIKYFAGCDEIWHAGDLGVIAIADKLKEKKIFKAVYGNIDGYDVRSEYPEILEWKCEEVKVLMLHIGGYPPKYNTATKKLIKEINPQLFISGHSHILKIMYDAELNCLHMNPGAAGKHGWHQMRTLIRFTIDGKEIKDCEVIELGKR